jgi:hypothetical protein
MSAAFSAIMMTGALVFPEVKLGMIEASTTRKPPNAVQLQPRVDHRHVASWPILQVPTG